MIDLAVKKTGMVCNAGLNATAACAAIRCRLNDFAETDFVDSYGDSIVGAQVSLKSPWRARAKLAHMAAMAIMEAFSDLPQNDISATPVLLCLAEADRPGRIQEQDPYLLHEIQEICQIHFHPQSKVIPAGRTGGVRAIETASELMANGRHRHCLVVGVDTYLTAATLRAYDKARRILTDNNPDGFIPGEAAAAALLAPIQHAPQASIAIKGVGFGRESAHIGSDTPLRADGMVQAVKSALAMAGCEWGDLDYRICDISGEHYYFKEATLALTRILRKRKETFDIWHPAECTGETGAAIVPVVLAVASAAAAKKYGNGDGVLCHFSDDNGQRTAVVLHTVKREKEV